MDEQRRWTVPVGLFVIALTVVATAAGPVGVGTSGRPLVAAVGLVCFVVAGAAFLLADGPPGVLVGLLLVMAVAVTVVHYADPAGPVVGLYLVVAFSPLRLGERPAVAVALSAVVLFDAGILVDSSDTVVFVLVVTGGAVFFFLFGLLLRREVAQRRRADQLLVELRASRVAELRSAALAERGRLAREIHDVLAHTLSGLSVQLEGIGLAVANGSADPELVSRVSRAQSLARDGLREARQAVSTLRGDVVPGTEQIPELVEEHRHGDPAACRFVEVGEPTALPADARLALYRTAQEALSNIRKHAPGADAVVELRWAPALVTLCVQDGGQKEAPVPAATGSTPGYGLKGLAERAALLGGSLEAGPSNDGFLVRLAVPLRREDGR